MLPQIWHRYIFLFGIIGLATGMLFGAIPISVPQIILGANWVLEKNFSEKWKQLKTNSVFWVLISLFLLHVLGMAYTENTRRGLDDLLNKLPLLAIPLVLFSTKPLSLKETRVLFGFFFLSVLASSMCCYLAYAGYTKKIVVDVRKASLFMSHIRFSLFIAFAIIGLGYSLVKEKKWLIKIVCFLMISWLLFFMYKLEMATGFLCLVVTGLFLSVFFSFNYFKKQTAFIIISSLLIGLIWAINTAIAGLTIFEKNPISSTNELLKKTTSGRYYLQDTTCKLAENGTLISININDFELKQEWEKKSTLLYDGKDKKGNKLRPTILRYMASMGMSKDSVTMNRLSKEDVYNIENGITNYQHSMHGGLSARWREFVWEYTEYKRGQNSSGHTLLMRLEFWKTAFYIIKKNALIGVGTGDIQDAFDEAYIETESKLDSIWRLRCHNQYLAIGVAFGCIGLMFFLFYLVYPAIVLRKKLHILYWAFFIIALLSFITEDTLETQAGVAFFIFFQTLFLWMASYRDKEEGRTASDN